MVFEWGDKKLIIETKNIKPFKKAGETYPVDRIRIYAHYKEKWYNYFRQ